MLLKVEALWRDVKQDPKLDKFVSLLAKDKNLKKNKVIVFTESKETAQYLEKKLKPKFDNKVLAFSSLSSESTRQKIIDNFDPSSRNKREDIQLLVSTDILSEGVNLNRSNVVINYDIPWNPIRIMQRVGRINRVSKNPPFDKIFTYNFFPAGPINENISLKELAEAKIKAFIEMLGNDSKLLTDEEIKSHEFLFKRLNSKEVIVGSDEEDPELRYLALLRGIRDENPDLFERIKCLPKKSRTARKHDKTYNSVLTFFRKGKLRKIFQTKGNLIEEVDFFRAAEILEAKNNLKKEKLQKDFYKYLEMNKKSFESIFISEGGDILRGRGRSYESKFIKRLKAIAKSPEFTDSDEDYIQEVLSLLKKGSLPKSTLKKILNDIKKEINPLKILARVRFGISPELFQPTFVTNAADVSGPKEVILSEYLIKK
jgi:superfamily II DNA/RNA helicase